MPVAHLVAAAAVEVQANRIDVSFVFPFNYAAPHRTSFNRVDATSGVIDHSSGDAHASGDAGSRVRSRM